MHMQSQLRALNERLDNSREWLAENEAHRDEWTAETEGATLPALVAFTDSLATVRRELDAAAASVAALERLAAAIETLERLSPVIETLRDAPERERNIRLYAAARSALEWRLGYDGPVIAATNETLALVEPARAQAEAEIARRHFEAAEKEAARRKAEERRKAEVRADARASTSTEAIVARARALMAEPGGAPNVIEAVDRARAEAGLPPTAPRGAAQEAAAANDAIVARARELMAESGGTLSVITAVDRASDEAATLAAGNRNAGEQQAWDRRMEQHDRVKDTLADTALALERRLMAHARELIAAARRAMADDPLKARELAIRAREAMAAIDMLFGKKPNHEPARRILQGARGRTA